ncbi:MAG: hypothetical protein Q7Q71_05745 [Verrucomicrobiota bacterium JB023]|nr:hypothetical protein [Verrucomicrobiota bacterium JB023]
MVHQDARGVVFRAIDRSSGREVALRRFFLPAEVLAVLSREGQGQRPVFAEGLDWLLQLNVPHLRKVIGGGLDDVDGTPYLVTDWWAGQSFAEALAAGELTAQDRSLLDAAAREMWEALPDEGRSSLSFSPEDVLVGDREGRRFSFWISPSAFFRRWAGFPEEGEASDWTGLLSQLGSSAKEDGPSVSPAEHSPPIVLKSAQGGGMGLLITVSVLTLLVIAAGAWWYLSTKPGEDELASAGEAAPKVEEVAGEAETDERVVAEEPEDPQELVAEKPVELVEQAEVDDLADPLGEEESSMAPAEDELTGLAEIPLAEEAMSEPIQEDEVIADSDQESEEVEPERDEEILVGDMERLQEEMGEEVVIRGVVKNVDESSSGKTWYLYFENEKIGGKTAMLEFRNGGDPDSGTFSDWARFDGKEVRARGRALVIRRGGHFPGVRIDRAADVQVLSDARVYQSDEAEIMRQALGADYQLTVEGIVTGFGSSVELFHIILDDSEDLRIAFEKEGSLGQDVDFRRKIGLLKEKKAIFTGSVRESGDGLILLLTETGDVVPSSVD